MINPEAMMYAIVRQATEDLTDLELAAVNNAAQLGTDPQQVLGYAQVAALFDQGGVRMNTLTKEALARVVLERLGAWQDRQRDSPA